MDDMAIAGLKNIRDETAEEIVKLNQHLNTLKLDLLAEKQLRRIQQLSLHNFDPQNENYDTQTIKIDETKSRPVSTDSDEPMNLANGTSKNAIVPFWKLSCEAKPVPAVDAKSNNSASYIIPSKIQKAQQTKDPSRASADKMLAFRTQRSLWNQSDKKPVGFQFKAPNNASPASSSAASNKTQTRSFGEGFSFFTSVTNEPTNPSIGGFNFHADVPTFPSTSEASSSSSTSSPQANGLMSSQYKRYRDHESPSMPSLSERLRMNGSGPKSSDR